MPIYEYRCSSCGFQKEYLRKLSDPVLSVCPECSKPTFSKMLTAAGFQLKGSGWYATDFKNSGAKPAAKPDTKSTTVTSGTDKSGATTSGSDKGGAKSDTKSDAKSDAKSDTSSGGKSESKSESKAVGSGADVRT
jgi:putative FmdB family regulatory protein